MSRTRSTVVSNAPTSTTNITGFFASVTGLSLTKESRTARLAICGSKSGRAWASFLGRRDVGSLLLFTTGGGVNVVAILLAPDPGSHQKRGKQLAFLQQ